MSQSDLLELEDKQTPEWFTVGKTTPASQKKNVFAGLHPLGRELLEDDETTCGDCRHKYQRRRKYWKCELGKTTFGRATDIRLKWRACEEFELEEDPQ